MNLNSSITMGEIIKTKLYGKNCKMRGREREREREGHIVDAGLKLKRKDGEKRSMKSLHGKLNGRKTRCTK